MKVVEIKIKPNAQIRIKKAWHKIHRRAQEGELDMEIWRQRDRIALVRDMLLQIEVELERL